MHRDRRLTLLLLLLPLLVSLSVTAGKGRLLPPDPAFRVSGRTLDPASPPASWDIADGYSPDRDRFGSRSDTPGIETGDARMPAAESEQDKVAIYRGDVDSRVPIERGPDVGATRKPETGSQGCADGGGCYPPHKQPLPMPAGAASPASAAPTGALERPAPDTVAGLGQWLGFGREDKIPKAEEAFRFTAEIAAPDRLRLTWNIADGTFLYREKIRIAVADTPHVALGPYELPAAEIKPDTVRPDGTIGDVAIYHHRIDLPLPLVRGTPEPTRLNLVVRYQGCAERGICYPPVTRRIGLDLPAATAVTNVTPSPTQATVAATPLPETTADSEPLSESDRIAALLAGGNPWVIVALFFGFGLLLAFTPCAFPMIPILSGIIVGQGAAITTGKAFLLSLVYVSAMALTYAAAGVLAGLFGANLPAAFQNAWVLGLFALVFVALALSMFGFYELQLPSRLQSKLADVSNRQEGGTLAGVAIMGLLSALIVGPCVAPPLAGALIFIGQTGDWLLGGASLFALSLGMGAPLIAIGTSAGKLLPKAGAWMDAVKAVFGVALLAVAILLLERILPPAVAMALWGLLLICSAVYLGALRQLPPGAGGWKKLWQGLGLFLLTYGVLMLVGAAAGSKDTLQPLRGLGLGGGEATEQHAVFKPIKSSADLDRELTAAASAGKPVLLDFYADWCVSCKELERSTFSDPTVVAELDRFLLLQADVTANDAQDQALMRGRFAIPGPPAILFFDPEGRELRGYRVIGFKPAREFVNHLRRIIP